MGDVDVLNPGLYWVHRISFFVWAAFAALMAVIGVSALFSHPEDAEVGLLAIYFFPFTALHWYAAKGARLGKTYGRKISIGIACLWLIGFPVGTVLAIYVFSKTGRDWKPAEMPA